MKSEIPPPSHITTGNVFDDLGFTSEKALQLKIKCDLFLAIRDRIESAGYTQRELCRILEEHQPQVSNLLRGRTSKMSIERLLAYANRLGLDATLKIHAVPTAAKPKPRTRRTIAA